MKTIKINQLSILFLILGMAACDSPVHVQQNATGETSLSDMKTYAWLPNIDTNRNAIYHDELVMGQMRMEVNRELEARGYILDTEDPDLVVLTHLHLKKEGETVYRPTERPVYYKYQYYYDKFEPETWYDGYYERYYSIPVVKSYSMEDVEFVKATFVIDIIDPQKKELLWRGYTSEHLGPSSIESEISENVKDIFEEYPVAISQ